MATDDWRLRVELSEGHDSLLERLGVLDNDADDLADELRESRLSVTHDEDTVFVYGAASLEIEKAKAVVERELGELHITPREVVTEHWLAEDERWDSEAPGPDGDDETLAEGYAPWEVRFRMRSHGAARELAEQLTAEG